MGELQIKITLGDLDVFLQGDGELVYKVFSDIRENGVGKLGRETSTKIQNSPLPQELLEEQKVEAKTQQTQSVVASVKNRKKNPQNTGQLLKDLDLSERNGASKSLREFIAEKNPASNVQKTATFVYYLENIMKVSEITIDHIFTCYKTMGYRMPNNLQQNLTDTCSSRYGYISRKEGKFSMTVVGNNYIEFDMNEAE